MLGERVSIVVVPRSRWSLAVRSLEAVVERMPPGAELIYVDGGSPPETSTKLQRLVTSVDGRWIRRDCVLAGNEARNIGLAEASREFIVFIDNDIIPGNRWIDHLVQCAEETEAAVVGPLILHGRAETSADIHIAGGDLGINDGVMNVNDRHHEYESLAEVGELQRSPSRQLEFHCMLMRRDFADRIAPLDEQLLSIGDHEDVVLQAASLGLEAWFEPTSVVTYLSMIPVTDDEIAYWQLRWSEEWCQQSLERFTEKWDIALDDGWPVVARRWVAKERTRWYHGRSRLHSYAGKAVRFVNGSRVTAPLVRTIEERIMGRDVDEERSRRESVLGRH